MSIKITEDGKRILREAYQRQGWSQNEWARQADYTEMVVKRLVGTAAGSVSQKALERLCEVVDVDWRDVVEAPQIADRLSS